MKISKVTPIISAFLLIPISPAFSFNLIDGLTLKEAMNLTTMLEASSGFVYGLPLGKTLTLGEEINVKSTPITWTMGNGDLAATFSTIDTDTGFVMTGEATDLQTFTGLGTFQEAGVRQNPTVNWSGSFSETGWNSNLSGTINNQLFNLTYTGVLNGELGEDITVSFSGIGSAYSNPVQIVEGESQFSYDSGLDAYTTMNFKQLVKYDDPLWLWIVGGEALVGGVIGGVTEPGQGWQNKVGGVFKGIVGGLGLSVAALTVRKLLADEPPPSPPSQPSPPTTLVPPLPGTPDQPIFPAPPEKITTVPEPSCVIGLLALGTLGAATTFRRKIKTYKFNNEVTQ